MKKRFERIIIGGAMVAVCAVIGARAFDKSREVRYFAGLPRLTTEQLLAASQGTVCRFDATIDTTNPVLQNSYVAFTVERAFRNGKSTEWRVDESHTPPLQLDMYGQKVQLNSYNLLNIAPVDRGPTRVHGVHRGDPVGVFGKVGPHDQDGHPTLQGPWYSEQGPLVGSPDTDRVIAQWTQSTTRAMWACVGIGLVGLVLLLYSIFRE